MNKLKPKLFIILGMPRTGTTFLYHVLQHHPSIFLPYRKESYYFSVNHHKGMEWFQSLYRDMSANRIGADIGPVYFLDPLSIPRITEYDPSVKVILGVRDAVGYSISQYSQIDAFGWKMPPIEEMVKGYDWKLSPQASLRLDFRNQFLSRRIDEIRHRFNDNLLLYDFRVIKKSPMSLLNAIETFLEIPHCISERHLETGPINASARRNIRFVNYLLRSQRVLDLIYGTLPRGVLRLARRVFDRMSISPANSKELPSIQTDQYATLSKFFHEDQQRIDELFAVHSIQTGSGRPFC